MTANLGYLPLQIQQFLLVRVEGSGGEDRRRLEEFLLLYSPFVRYDGEVGNARSCAVSFVDSDGIRHTVEVAAESLYEAAALAMKEFRRHPWSDDVAPGKMTPLEITIQSAVTSHQVNVRQVERWVASSAKSPSDTLLKSRVRALLEGR